MRCQFMLGSGMARAVLLMIGMMLPQAGFAQAGSAFWISMRGVGHEAQPSFVTLSPVATPSHRVAFSGCRGVVWWLEPAGASVVQAARAAGETVQIHRGAAGSTPDRATVVCLVQAGG